MLIAFPLVCCTSTTMGCTLAEPRAETKAVDLDFTGDDAGWRPGFSDYEPAQAEAMNLEASHRPLPAELSIYGSGLYVAGTNLSDDLFMFWTGAADDLAPFTRYDVHFEVDVATAAPAECAGIGGAPGEAVHLKVAATLEEPKAQREEVDERTYVQMNVDKGDQAEAGADALVLGDIANSNTDCDSPVWEIKTLRSVQPLSIRTLDDGTVWLLVGTDSGFEGRTELYYTRYRARFEVL